MSLVYVFAAMKMESEPVERLIGLKPDSARGAAVKAGQCGPNEVILFTTGMGPRRTRARAAPAFGSGIAQTGPARRPDATIVIGLRGGLSPSFGEGTIVSYTQCLSTENSQGPLSCSPSLVDQQVDLLTSKGVPCERVVGITSPRVGTPLGEKLSLAKSGASVVDMESYEIIARGDRVGGCGSTQPRFDCEVESPSLRPDGIGMPCHPSHDDSGFESSWVPLKGISKSRGVLSHGVVLVDAAIDAVPGNRWVLCSGFFPTFDDRTPRRLRAQFQKCGILPHFSPI